jgi:hypothetical protein
MERDSEEDTVRSALISGDEHDALTRSRRRLAFRPGERKEIKNRVNRRVRKEDRRLARNGGE